MCSLIDFYRTKPYYIPRSFLDVPNYTKSCPALDQVIIAKGNIIEGIEAKE